MHRILEQITAPSPIDIDKDYATVVISPANSDSIIYQFNVVRGNIILAHKSHAPIAAVSGKKLIYKSSEIRATNHAFKWLGIKCAVTYEIKKIDGVAELRNGVISFFPEE